MKTIKICGWITFVEKMICLVLLAVIFLAACSCMSMAESCASSSVERINDVDPDSVTAGYEVLGNVGSFLAGGTTYVFAGIIIMLAFIPFMIYVITSVINIVGLVKLRQFKTRVISASAIVTIIADILIMTIYLVMMVGALDLTALLIIMIFVGGINVFDIIVNATLLHNVNKVKSQQFQA